MQKSLETTIKTGSKHLGPDDNSYLVQIITLERAKLGPDNNSTACMHIYIYIYAYAYAVKLKAGPLVALLKLKTGHFCFCFYFESLFLPAERRGFFEKQAKQQQKQFLKLNIGPSMLCNILGPVFNFNLDQFLTLARILFFFWFLGAETPISIVFSANMQNIKKHKKEKKKNTICEHTCANCSCQNVRFFFLHFSFLMFLEFPCFSEIFLIGFQ